MSKKRRGKILAGYDAWYATHVRTGERIFGDGDEVEVVESHKAGYYHATHDKIYSGEIPKQFVIYI